MGELEKEERENEELESEVAEEGEDFDRTDLKSPYESYFF